MSARVQTRRDRADPAVCAPEPGFGVYIHWPFCESKCPYCDFNSHVRDAVDHGRWRRALLAELDHYAGETAGRRVTSIFLGGGTPSLMEPETVAAVISRVAARWALVPEAEITLEANPSSVEAGRFAAFRAAGINRTSLGVQALDDSALAFLAPPAQRPRGAGRARGRAPGFPAVLLRPDLRPAGSEPGGLAQGSAPRALA